MLKGVKLTRVSLASLVVFEDAIRLKQDAGRVGVNLASADLALQFAYFALVLGHTFRPTRVPAARHGREMFVAALGIVRETECAIDRGRTTAWLAATIRTEALTRHQPPYP
jgi:hypothetical protein